ncbi:MAG: hypothetical protein CMG61_02455 [Candidatus Marinimicrobia bacterium]|nr:hypothetical protein [Candidatus Neomarinimicrobiota bacterium]|tara:strand:- start:3531 stop:3968 length:438 start_codon:yes stop_codon:yes gene_type:complete
MKNKINIFTEELNSFKEIEKFKIKKDLIVCNNDKKWLEKIPHKNIELRFYDLGFSKNPQKIIPVKNHINKTGLNPLKNKSKTTVVFYDITSIYQKQPGSKVVECYGGWIPPKIKKTQSIQARSLCYFTVMAYCSGFKNIRAFVII